MLKLLWTNNYNLEWIVNVIENAPKKLLSNFIIKKDVSHYNNLLQKMSDIFYSYLYSKNYFNKLSLEVLFYLKLKSHNFISLKILNKNEDFTSLIKLSQTFSSYYENLKLNLKQNDIVYNYNNNNNDDSDMSSFMSSLENLDISNTEDDPILILTNKHNNKNKLRSKIYSSNNILKNNELNSFQSEVLLKTKEEVFNSLFATFFYFIEDNQLINFKNEDYKFPDDFQKPSTFKHMEEQFNLTLKKLIFRNEFSIHFILIKYFMQENNSFSNYLYIEEYLINKLELMKIEELEEVILSFYKNRNASLFEIAIFNIKYLNIFNEGFSIISRNDSFNFKNIIDFVSEIMNEDIMNTNNINTKNYNNKEIKSKKERLKVFKIIFLFWFLKCKNEYFDEDTCSKFTKIFFNINEIKNANLLKIYKMLILRLNCNDEKNNLNNGNKSYDLINLKDENVFSTIKQFSKNKEEFLNSLETFKFESYNNSITYKNILNNS